MNDIKIQAIVIDSKDYKEADKKLALFSVEHGLIWATIKGVKKPKAKLASIGQPFCYAEFLLNKKGDFYTVMNASVIENFFEITSDFDKYSWHNNARILQKNNQRKRPIAWTFCFVIKISKTIRVWKCFFNGSAC